MSDLQALEKQFLIEEVTIGDTVILGSEIISIEPPNKGFPAWKIEYNGFDGPIVLITSGQPVTISGKKLVVVEEETVEEEE